MFAVAVAVCPPLALLLAVELVNRAVTRHRTDTTTESRDDATDTVVTGTVAGPAPRLAHTPGETAARSLVTPAGQEP